MLAAFSVAFVPCLSKHLHERGLSSRQYLSLPLAGRHPTGKQVAFHYSVSETNEVHLGQVFCLSDCNMEDPFLILLPPLVVLDRRRLWVQYELQAKF